MSNSNDGELSQHDGPVTLAYMIGSRLGQSRPERSHSSDSGANLRFDHVCRRLDRVHGESQLYGDIHGKDKRSVTA